MAKKLKLGNARRLQVRKGEEAVLQLKDFIHGLRRVVKGKEIPLGFGDKKDLVGFIGDWILYEEQETLDEIQACVDEVLEGPKGGIKRLL